jgi:hypothetical protein
VRSRFVDKVSRGVGSIEVVIDSSEFHSKC